MPRRPNQDGTVSSYVTKTGETKYRIAYQVDRVAPLAELWRSSDFDERTATQPTIDEVVDELKKGSRNG